MSETDSHSEDSSILFLDHRHIRCGDLQWTGPDGERIPNHPRTPQIEARPELRYLPRGVRLEAQPAQQLEPIPGLTGMVIHDGGVYRAWTLDEPHGRGESGPIFVIHTQSDDGFTWQETGRTEMDIGGQFTIHGWGVFIDPNGPPEERYKAIYSSRAPREQWDALYETYQQLHPRNRDWRIHPSRKVICTYGAVSPDGLHWTSIKQPLMTHMSDTDGIVYYDQWLGRYVFYTRWYDYERRSVRRAEAEDFRHWGPLLPCMEPGLDDLSADIYTNGRTEYPGHPRYHLMFPMIYDRWTQTSQIRLAASTDGVWWRSVPGGPVIRTGPPGQWRGEFMFSGRNLVEIGENVAVPYWATGFPHKYPKWPQVTESGGTAWATWQKGRLCALKADVEGEMYTFPLRVAGKQLRLNLRSTRAGEVRVAVYRAKPAIADGTDSLTLPTDEITSVAGRGLQECDPLYGDHTAATVRWGDRSDVGIPVGELATLQIRLRAAEVFGLEWV